MDSPLTDAQIIARAQELASRFGDSPSRSADQPASTRGVPPSPSAAERLLPSSRPARGGRLPWLGDSKPEVPSAD